MYELSAKYIPVLSWLSTYNLQDLKGDFIAGFTVGLTVVPQGLALAQLANLPPQVYICPNMKYFSVFFILLLFNFLLGI